MVLVDDWVVDISDVEVGMTEILIDEGAVSIRRNK